MKDTISRQAAIKAVESLPNCYNGYSDTYDKSCFIGLLEDLPSEQPEQRWIPCSERLPEDYTDVLVWFEYFRYGSYNRMYQTYGIGTYSGQYEYDSWMINHETGWNNLRVIAWMPLPEPYNADMKGD